MYPNLCLPVIGQPDLPLDDLLVLASAHGFGGLDLPLTQLRTVDEAALAGARIREAGLRWGLFWMTGDPLSADDAAHAECLQRLERALPLVAAAGCQRTYVHIWPDSDRRPYAENLRWHRDRLRPVVDLLGGHGVTLGIEFIGPQTLRRPSAHPFIHRLDQALELITALGPSSGLVFDTFHWYCSGGTIADLVGLPSSCRVVNVHANDAVPGRQRHEQLDAERDLPLATGVIDALGALAVLADRGYDGPVIAEPFEPQRSRLGGMEPAAAAAEVGACLGRLIEAAQQRAATDRPAR